MFITFKAKRSSTVNVININHIISMDYQPAYQINWDDDEGCTLDPPRNVPSNLRLATTEQVSDEVYSYGGEHLTNIAISRVYVLSGDEADKVYAMIPTFPTIAAR